MKNSPKAACTGWISLLAACACLKFSVDIRAQPIEAPLTVPTIACSPDKPTVRPRETINLRAWTAAISGEPEYVWTTTGGRIDANAAAARWNFADVEPGGYSATVRATGAGGRIADCSVRIIVQPASHIRGRETGWSFLVTGETEGKGYGLYSYLLLGSLSGDASRERYRKAIEAYLGLIPDILSLEQYIPRQELNVTYLPLTIPPPEGTVSPDWVLENYDYARARSLLAALPGSLRDGPYFVSFLRPTSWAAAPTGRYLFQDLSRTPAHLVSLWAKEFFNQAAQERFWEERTARQLVLKLRTTIGILAVGLPDVRKAVDDWIAWVR